MLMTTVRARSALWALSVYGYTSIATKNSSASAEISACEIKETGQQRNILPVLRSAWLI